jgi:16S rRNA (adenine1518-N6/adenine1519-N6)-dimethyltransferase
MRRKQLGRVLRSVAGLSAEEAEAVVRGCGLDPQARPEVLSPEAFARVVRALRARPRA